MVLKEKRIPAALLLAGSGMAVLGWLAHPVAIDKHIEAGHVVAAAEHVDAWVWSFRFLVFGLFLRMGGLVGFGTLFHDGRDRAIFLPAIAIAGAGLAISALGEGYYMDVVIHAGWRFANDANTEPSRSAFLQSLMPLNEWVSCLKRMGLMFLGLGTVGIGAGLLRAQLHRTAAFSGLAIGMGVMMLLMVRPDGLSHQLAFVSLAAWHALLGALVFKK